MRIREFFERTEKILRRDAEDDRIRDFFVHLCGGMDIKREVDDVLIKRARSTRVTAIYGRNASIRDGLIDVLGYNKERIIAPDEISRLQLAVNAAILELLEAHRSYPNYLFETVNRELSRLKEELDVLFAEIAKAD